MRIITDSLLYLTVLLSLGVSVWQYEENRLLAAEKVDLIWRNVSVEQRKEPHEFKGLDFEAASKASRLTGIPIEIIINMRKAENGGIGYEMGYRGKSEAIVENYTPPQWQYGEAARRMNEFAWEYLEADKKRFKEVTEYMAKRYTGRVDSKGYAKMLRQTP